jgi:Cu-Zn family superoxide dismutase
MTTKANLIGLFALLTAVGCDKSDGGAGANAPSPQYQGIEEPTKAEPGNAPSRVPTQGAAPGGDTLNAEQMAGNDSPDTPGQVNTPITAFGGDSGSAGTTSAPSGNTGPSGERPSEKGPLDKVDVEAKAEFKAAPGIKLKGEAELEVVASGVKIEVEVEKAPPGVKGIHVHQKPDCTNIPAKSMGDHFAPDVKEHGLPGSGAHHLGDLGNITIDKDGKGELEIVVTKANLKQGDPLSFLGRAIVIHEKSDEGAQSQPAGNSGKPIACAVIKPE